MALFGKLRNKPAAASQSVRITGNFSGSIVQVSGNDAPIGSLPPAPPAFFIADLNLKQFLDSFYEASDAFNVSVFGMSGIGKTSHVSNWVGRNLNNKQIEPSRVQYLDLSGVTYKNRELLARQMLSIMRSPIGNLSRELQVDSILALWRSWVREHVDLVIYDAVESQEIIPGLRSEGAAKSIFVSTLNLTDVDRAYPLSVFTDEQSFSFVRGVFAKGNRSIGTQQVEQISAVCEGLPLALHAAAAALSLLPSIDLKDGIAQFVESSSMNAMSESWEARVTRRLTACVLLLPEEKRRPWATLAQFENSFFPFQASILLSLGQSHSVSFLLSQLANRSLLQLGPGLTIDKNIATDQDKLKREYDSTYRMHRLFRKVANELYPLDDLDRSRYGQAIYETVGRANQFSRTKEYGKIGYELNCHTIRDKYPGFDALAETESLTEAEFLAEFPLFGIHQMDVPPAQRLDWLNRAAEVLSTRLQNSENYTELLLKVRSSQAQQLDELARYDEALKLIEEVYPLSEENSDQRASLDTLRAVVLGHSGACSDAISYNTKSLKHWIIVGNDRERSTAYNNRGLLYLGINDLKRAIRFCEISLKIDRELGLDGDAAFNLQNLAQMYLMVHQDDKAVERADEAEAICTAFENRSLLPGVMQVQGSLALRRALQPNTSENFEADQSDLDRALERYQKALDIEQSMGRPVKIVAALQNLAAATLYVPETGPQRAAELNAEAINLSEDQDIPWASVSARRNLGHIFYISGHTENAVEFYKNALEVSRQKLAAFQHLQIIDGFTDILLREFPQRHQECLELLNEGLEVAEKSGLPQFNESFMQRLAHLD